MDDDRAYEEQQYIDGKPGGGKHAPGRIIKTVLKVFAISIILLIYLLLFWRMSTAHAPSEVQKFVWTQEAIDAYDSDPSSFMVYTRSNNNFNINKDGSFSADNWRYIENINQLQFTIRYNNSTVKYLMQEYSLEEKPVGEPFIYILTDSKGNKYTDYSYIPYAKNMYNYRQIVFNNIDLYDLTSVVLNIYYVGDVDFSSSPYKELEIYKTEQPLSAFPEKGQHMTYTAYETIDNPSKPDEDVSYKSYTEYILYPLEPFTLSRDMYSSEPNSGLLKPVSYLVKEN